MDSERQCQEDNRERCRLEWMGHLCHVGTRACLHQSIYQMLELYVFLWNSRGSFSALATDSISNTGQADPVSKYQSKMLCGLILACP